MTAEATLVLVDDPGHPADLYGAVESRAARQEMDLETISASLGSGLRLWLRRSFFEWHRQLYSRSHRKAPIYWQLGTASGGYSVWLYYHRFTPDTMFRVLNDHLDPKLRHEEGKLVQVRQNAGADPSRSQLRDIDAQEAFVDELRAFRAEVARVAPLWNPDLNDGVIINFAPLWRLVPQNRQWQRECKACWDKLVAGEYDWSHLAMHLWPERVVPKCLDDRSLAIAHGLEDLFWVEGPDGKWQKRAVEPATVAEAISQRTSSAVKAALNDLLSAPSAVGGCGRKAAGRKAATPLRKEPVAAATLFKEPVAPKAPKTQVEVSDDTVRAVREAIARVAGGASRADVQAALGLSDAEWNRAIATLLERGDVTRSGQKRGTRYHSPGAGGEK